MTSNTALAKIFELTENHSLAAADVSGVEGEASLKDVAELYKMYIPSNKDGTVDMSAELEAFVSANQGYKICVLAERILLNSFGQGSDLAATDHVLLDFGACTVLYDNDAPAIDLDNTANAGDEVTVSAISDVTLNTNSLSTELTIDATISGEAHDFIAIYSDDAYPSKAGGVMGEIAQLIQDEDTLTLNTARPLGRTSDFSTAIKCRKLDSARRVWIHGGVFTANGDADDDTITTRMPAIKLLGFVDPQVKDIALDKPWAEGVVFQCTAAAHQDCFTMKNVLNQSASNGLSHGVVLYGMNYAPHISNVVVRNCHNPVGTTKGDEATTTTWYEKGYPTYYLFQKVHGVNSYGVVCDSSEFGYGGGWKDINVFNSATDEYEAETGKGIRGRAAKEFYQNVVIRGGSGGFDFPEVDHGFEDETFLQNVYMNDLHDGSATAKAIEAADNTQTNVRHFVLQNVNMDDIDIALDLGKNNKLTFDGLSVSKAKTLGDIEAAAKVVGIGLVSDHRNTTATGETFVFNCKSTVEDGGCEIRILDKPIVMRGDSADQPTEFFTEADTLADKTVYHPGIISYNPDAVTALVSKSAGETTFVDATDVTEIALTP